MWAKNYAINDTATALKLMAPEFAMTSSNGRIKNRMQELNDVRATPGLALHYFRTRDVMAEEVGNVGLVKGIAEWSFTMNGKKNDTVRHYNAVYYRGGDLGWQLIGLYINAQPGTWSLAPVKWLEGDWVGSGGGVAKPFYERYRMQDDSTLIVESFDDATFGKVTETSTWESRHGFITNRGDSQYIAQSISADSIVFIPLRNVGNSFVWKRGSDNQWYATIRWAANEKRAAGERTYTMNRK